MDVYRIDALCCGGDCVCTTVGCGAVQWARWVKQGTSCVASTHNKSLLVVGSGAYTVMRVSLHNRGRQPARCSK
eukprot:7586751-Pyramimonas_sp.AAC.2